MIVIYIVVGILLGMFLLNSLNNIKRKIYYGFNNRNKFRGLGPKAKEPNKYEYQAQYLMTINEKNQFRKIQSWANKHNLIVFTKVRLLDLVAPKKSQNNYKGALWKIQAKHIDFIICDQNINVKCVIEINDSSHNRQDRKERDNFVTEILESCGYKLLMTYNITDEQLDNVCGYTQPKKEQEI